MHKQATLSPQHTFRSTGNISISLPKYKLGSQHLLECTMRKEKFSRDLIFDRNTFCMLDNLVVITISHVAS